MSADLLQGLTDRPVLLAVTIALSTLILEDPVTLATGVLIAEGRVSFLLGVVALTVGIAGGDLLLFLAGRYLTGWSLVQRWMARPRIATAAEWLQRNAAVALITARFIPGMRLPIYVAAGLSPMRLGTFAGFAIFASLLWTLLLLTIVSRAGALSAETLGSAKLVIIPFVILWAIFALVLGRWTRLN